MSFEKIKVEIFIPIRPRLLSDPSTSIFQQLSKNLLRYSNSLGGFPMSFTIEGIFESGQILEDGSIYVNCLIDFCVLKIIPHEQMYCSNGALYGIFPVIVDEDNAYTGEFAVKGFSKNVIIGTQKGIEEESDF